VDFTADLFLFERITTFTMKDMKKKFHVLHELHGNLSLFVVPPRAWMLVGVKYDLLWKYDLFV